MNFLQVMVVAQLSSLLVVLYLAELPLLSTLVAQGVITLSAAVFWRLAGDPVAEAVTRALDAYAKRWRR